VCDGQAALEKTLTGLPVALAGPSIIYGAGMLEMGVTFDLAQLVMDNEIARMVRKYLAGVPVNDETLALDEIRDIGSFKDYLSTDFTYAHMRELSISNLLDRRVRVEWEAGGAFDAAARATAEALRILDGHQVEPLPDEVRDGMTRILAEVEVMA
jgi:trimethylamine--corrinoid protein Co-methyltransferase